MQNVSVSEIRDNFVFFFIIFITLLIIYYFRVVMLKLLLKEYEVLKRFVIAMKKTYWIITVNNSYNLVDRIFVYLQSTGLM